MGIHGAASIESQLRLYNAFKNLLHTEMEALMQISLIKNTDKIINTNDIRGFNMIRLIMSISTDKR